MKYEMMFVRDFGAFKKGQTTECSQPIAEMWKAEGVAVEAQEAQGEPKKAKTKKKGKATK